MHTSRLYYDDCYTSLFKAEVLALSADGRRAYLDQTYFYPTSGGQPHDTGSIDGVPVEDVLDEEHRIAHILAPSPNLTPLSVGALVECRLDWGRRSDHMQQHTGQHLLSAAFSELLGHKTLSFHMGEDVSTIELATGKLEDAHIDAVERRANDIVSEARPVRITYEDAGQATALRKPSERTGVLRIITIDSYDRSACGGTHVRSTAEIGAIQIRNLERIRGNVRLEFVCGARQNRRSKQDFQLLTRLSKLLSVQPLAIEEHVANLRIRLDGAEKALTKANLALAQVEAGNLYQQTPASSDGIRRHLVLIDELKDECRLMALGFAAHSKALMACVPRSLPGAMLLACSADSGLHAGSLWKAAFSNGGGRGGGSATLAQGNVVDAKALQMLIDSVGLQYPFPSA